MQDDRRVPTDPSEERTEHELRRQLDAIREEPVPERLLELARELQRLLKAREKDGA